MKTSFCFFVTLFFSSAIAGQIQPSPSPSVAAINSKMACSVQPGAGAGASCSTDHSTEVIGVISLTTSSQNPSAGPQAEITKSKSCDSSQPLCIAYPGDGPTTQLMVSSGIYLAPSANGFTVNFQNADKVGNSYTIVYHCFCTY